MKLQLEMQSEFSRILSVFSSISEKGFKVSSHFILGKAIDFASESKGPHFQIRIDNQKLPLVFRFFELCAQKLARSYERQLTPLKRLFNLSDSGSIPDALLPTFETSALD